MRDTPLPPEILAGMGDAASDARDFLVPALEGLRGGGGHDVLEAVRRRTHLVVATHRHVEQPPAEGNIDLGRHVEARAVQIDPSLRELLASDVQVAEEVRMVGIHVDLDLPEWRVVDRERRPGFDGRESIDSSVDLQRDTALTRQRRQADTGDPGRWDTACQTRFSGHAMDRADHIVGAQRVGLDVQVEAQGLARFRIDVQTELHQIDLLVRKGQISVDVESDD